MLLPEHLEGLKLLERAPAIFQCKLPPNKDVRRTVVGEYMFAAESGSEFLDWRVDESVVWRRHDLSEDVAVGVRKLMSLLGLAFGSFDFRIAPDGKYMFLEVNPNGQFLFLELDDEHLPISAAFADSLISAGELERNLSIASSTRSTDGTVGRG